jgi:putative FmdB family regulatory protein
MPTYEYRCPSGHGFEKFYPSISDQRRAKCPRCRKMAERVISGGAGLVFKGSGFYITDYKRGNETAEKAKSSEGKSQSVESPKPKNEPPPSDK